MNRPLKVVVQGAVAALLVSATVLPASASYLGYGNGDPENWDLWQEQNGGKPVPDDTAVYYNQHVHHHYYSSNGHPYDHHVRTHAQRQASKHS
jgi:hypothetical protein